MSGITGASVYSKIDGTSQYKQYTMLPGETIDFFTRRIFEDMTGLEYDIDIKRYKLTKVENKEKGFVWTWSRKK